MNSFVVQIQMNDVEHSLVDVVVVVLVAKKRQADSLCRCPNQEMSEEEHSLVDVVEVEVDVVAVVDVVDVVDVAERNKVQVTLLHSQLHRFSLDVVELVVVVLVAKKRQADELFCCSDPDE